MENLQQYQNKIHKNKIKKMVVFLAIPVVLMAIAFFAWHNPFAKEAILINTLSETPLEVVEIIEEANLPEKTMIFVGDIMLDRGVELQMKKTSFVHPFEKIKAVTEGIDLVFGNLEGPISVNPPDFGPASLEFGFASSTIEGLLLANFNLLSLANNHTLNMKKEGLEETKQLLNKVGIRFVGHPAYCELNLLYKENGIIIVSFNTTFPFNCSDDEIVDIIALLRQKAPDDFLIVSFHWGQEYKPTSSKAQQDLAHQVIDSGADLIVGGHPHVVQEIEEYKGKIIFYSLGNFIFDQHFSQETKQGLIFSLDMYADKLVFKLLPIKSYLQADVLEQAEGNLLLEDLAQKSSANLFDQIKQGEITLER